MAFVGALLFCTDCGAILDRCSASQQKIACDVWQKFNASKRWTNMTDCSDRRLQVFVKDRWPTSIVTVSANTSFPSKLRDARSEIQVLTAKDHDTWATTSHACPKCGNPKMKFRDVQLRSADEGSTIFYHCPKCDHRYNENN